MSGTNFYLALPCTALPCPALPCVHERQDHEREPEADGTHERERRAYPDDRVYGGDTQPVAAVRMASPQPALTTHAARGVQA